MKNKAIKLPKYVIFFNQYFRYPIGYGFKKLIETEMT